MLYLIVWGCTIFTHKLVFDRKCLLSYWQRMSLPFCFFLVCHAWRHKCAGKQEMKESIMAACDNVTVVTFYIFYFSLSFQPNANWTMLQNCWKRDRWMDRDIMFAPNVQNLGKKLEGKVQVIHTVGESQHDVGVKDHQSHTAHLIWCRQGVRFGVFWSYLTTWQPLLAPLQPLGPTRHASLIWTQF